MPAKMLPIDRQCLGKQQHRTRAEARAHKAALGYVGMEVYRCFHCGYYHVGHGGARPKEIPEWDFSKWLSGVDTDEHVVGEA